MLIVKKFGGTSVANKERIFNVANRCIEEYRKGNDVVVVLSAMRNLRKERWICSLPSENRCLWH